MEFDQIVNGVPLIFVVMGLVELVKAFGVQGKALTAASFGIGLALGLLYQVSLGVPAGDVVCRDPGRSLFAAQSVFSAYSGRRWLRGV